MENLQLLKKDPRGAIFEILRNRRLRWLRFWSTRWTYFTGKLKGVRMGKNIQFYGVPLIRRSPLTTITIGDNCIFRSTFASNLVGINRGCLICTWYDEAEVHIGNNVGMSGTVIGAAKKIVLEDNVMCGGNVFITDFDWHPVHPAKRHERAEAAETIIEENAWIGMNTTILKGVRIGANSVIAANSVVTRDIPPNVIAGGNPAKVLKHFDEVTLEELEAVQNNIH